MNYVYIRDEGEPDGLWTVGFYKPDGKFETDSDWSDREKAAERVHWLNGGNKEVKSENESK